MKSEVDTPYQGLAASRDSGPVESGNLMNTRCNQTASEIKTSASKPNPTRKAKNGNATCPARRTPSPPFDVCILLLGTKFRLCSSNARATILAKHIMSATAHTRPKWQSCRQPRLVDPVSKETNRLMQCAVRKRKMSICACGHWV